MTEPSEDSKTNGKKSLLDILSNDDDIDPIDFAKMPPLEAPGVDDRARATRFLETKIAAEDAGAEQPDEADEKDEDQKTEPSKEQQKPLASAGGMDRQVFMEAIQSVTDKKERQFLIKQFDEATKIASLKNMLYGMAVLVLNTDKVTQKTDLKECALGKELPQAEGASAIDAACRYYKPQGMFQGTERFVDEFVQKNIMDTFEHRDLFLSRVFAALADFAEKTLAPATEVPSLTTAGTAST